MASKSSDADGVQPSLLNDERHPVFDTWENLDTFNPPAASSDESGWTESYESSSLAEPLGQINWTTLGADEAEAESLHFNDWVNCFSGRSKECCGGQACAMSYRSWGCAYKKKKKRTIN